MKLFDENGRWCMWLFFSRLYCYTTRKSINVARDCYKVTIKMETNYFLLRSSLIPYITSLANLLFCNEVSIHLPCNRQLLTDIHQVKEEDVCF